MQNENSQDVRAAKPTLWRSPTFFTSDKSKPAKKSTCLFLALAFLPLVVKLITFLFSTPGYLAQSSYKVFQIAVPIIWRRRVDRKQILHCLWPLDEPLPSFKLWAAAAGVAVVLAGSAMMVIPFLAESLSLVPAQLRKQMDARFSMTPLRACFVVLYLFTINAALEELHFRAWLDRELTLRWGNLVGIGGSCLMFATMHVFIFAGMEAVSATMLALIFVALSIAGAAWSMLARFPGGIHAAWLSHGLTDAGLLTWGLFWLGYFN